MALPFSQEMENGLDGRPGLLAQWHAQEVLKVDLELAPILRLSMVEKNAREIVMRRGLVIRDLVQVNNFKDILNAVKCYAYGLLGPVSRRFREAVEKSQTLWLQCCFICHILNIVRSIHVSLLRYRSTKNGFTGPKGFRGFRETGPCSNFSILSKLIHAITELKSQTFISYSLSGRKMDTMEWLGCMPSEVWRRIPGKDTLLHQSPAGFWWSSVRWAKTASSSVQCTALWKWVQPVSFFFTLALYLLQSFILKWHNSTTATKQFRQKYDLSVFINERLFQ